MGDSIPNGGANGGNEAAAKAALPDPDWGRPRKDRPALAAQAGENGGFDHIGQGNWVTLPPAAASSGPEAVGFFLAKFPSMRRFRQAYPMLVVL